MIDRELLGKIKDKTDKDDDSFTDVPPEWAEGKQGKQPKKGRGCLIFFAICALLFLLLIIMVAIGDKPQNEHQVIPGPGRQDFKPPPSSHPHIERRTDAGVSIERGADIDYRIDSDRIINLSVNAIRYKGYRCNSVGSIKLYRHPERIVLECNGGRDKYWIEKDSAGRMRQVTRI